MSRTIRFQPAILRSAVIALVVVPMAWHFTSAAVQSITSDPCSAERSAVVIAEADLAAAEEARDDAQQDVTACFQANPAGPCSAEQAVLEEAEADVAAADIALQEAQQDLDACEMLAQ